MATITTSAVQAYSGTSTSTTRIVGRNASKNCVARYSFTTDSVGASTVSFEIPKNSVGSGTRPPLRWCITDSASSHIDAGSSTTNYDGTVTVTDVQGWDVFTGSVNKVLSPNTTYYLWIFPNTSTYGFYYLGGNYTATVTTSGAAGVVYIDNGTKLEAYQCYIDNGSGWDLYAPYVDNGTGWDVCG